MKVLSITHLFPNHIYPNNGIFVKERLKYIAKKIDLEVIAPVPYFPFFYLLKKYKNYNKIKTKEEFDTLHVYHPRYFNIPKFFKFLDGYFYYRSLNKFIVQKIKNSNIDIIDFHWVYPDAFAGLYWAKKHKKKIIVTIRGNESIFYFDKRKYKRKKIRRILKHVDHVITVSSDLKNKLINEYGIYGELIDVISNGIDTRRFYPIDKNEAKKKCRLDINKRYILSLSRLGQEKGIKFLLQAFAEISDKNVELLIVGEGPEKKELLGISKKLNIYNRVKFIGAVAHDDTCIWYNSADIYCLPSLWDGYPNSAVEALACGTPVVSTTVGGIPDIVKSDDCGYLAEPADSEALKKRLLLALGKKWDRNKIAAIGSENTWYNVADKVIQIYSKVLT